MKVPSSIFFDGDLVTKVSHLSR